MPREDNKEEEGERTGVSPVAMLLSVSCNGVTEKEDPPPPLPLPDPINPRDVGHP